MMSRKRIDGGQRWDFPTLVFDCLCFSLFVALSPLSVCHLCFATVSVYRDLAIPRIRNPHYAQQRSRYSFAAITH